MADKPNRKVYTVTELTRRIRLLLEEVGEIWLEGEVSNVRTPASGHCYFTIKDDAAQIAAVLFRGTQRTLRVQPRDGMVVRVFGRLTVYERSGNYQIVVQQMEEGGKGALLARFEELKKKLAAEGLFDAARKRPIPMLPQHVGVVTSPTGAAIRDILNIITRRFPNLHVLIAPVRVQGEGAAAEIAAAIDLLGRRGGLDVLIVGRGGGSLEDLWAFNEEVVARAIARSPIPVISAVGHEIDYTISDFVADLRAPTPSAAAELVVHRKDAFEDGLADQRRRLTRALRQCALQLRNRVLTVRGSPALGEPRHVVRRHLQRVEAVQVRMKFRLDGIIRDTQQRLDETATAMVHRTTLMRQSRREDLRRLDVQLRALSPMETLKRGYSLTWDEQRKLVRQASDLRRGQRIFTRVARGTLEAEVRGTTDE